MACWSQEELQWGEESASSSQECLIQGITDLNDSYTQLISWNSYYTLITNPAMNHSC